MIKLPINLQTLYADLIQQCQDASFDETYGEGGNFTLNDRNGKLYYYYKPSAKEPAAMPKTIYVGPKSNPEIEQRVQNFKSIKHSFSERQVAVNALRAAGLPQPADGFSASVIEALWKAGFFRLRGVLVGTAAFQTYAGILGVRLDKASMSTGDADFAQFHSISTLVEDSMPPMHDTLKKIDPTFRPVLDIDPLTPPAAFINDRGYRIEFLTPNRGSNENQGKATKMPALGGAGAEPLRYLDYLIYQPIHAVLLFKGGIPVTVPAPQRYAVHKLIVSVQRRTDANGFTKSAKDLLQAGILIEALSLDYRQFDLGLAWIEAWGRGRRWRETLQESILKLPAARTEILRAAIAETCEARGKTLSAYWPRQN